MKQITSRITLHLFAITTLASQSLTAADDGARDTEQNRRVTETIQLTDLPKPPEPLAKLIEQGTVKFFVGQLPSGKTGDALPGGRNKFQFKAETQFKMSFDYRSRTQWRIQKAGGKSKLVINVSFQQIKLKQKHDVWFKKRPAAADFWTNRLVLHEFDHIRLSADPGVEKRFAQRLRDSNLIAEELSGNTRVNDAVVRRVVDKHVQQVFDDILELVNIRNQELDRQTNHGMRPLPEDSSLSEWLR